MQMEREEKIPIEVEELRLACDSESIHEKPTQKNKTKNGKEI
jgi:hypothetical protein